MLGCLIGCAAAPDARAKPAITVEFVVEAEPYKSKLAQLQMQPPGPASRLQALQEGIAEQFALTCAAHLRFVDWMPLHKLPAGTTPAAALRMRLTNLPQQASAFRMVEFEASYTDAGGTPRGIQFDKLNRFVLYKPQQGPDGENYQQLEIDLMEKLGVVRPIDAPAGWIATDDNRKQLVREWLQFVPITLSQRPDAIPDVLMLRFPLAPQELSAAEESVLKLELRAATSAARRVVMEAQKREDEFDPTPGFIAVVTKWNHSVPLDAAALVALIANHPATSFCVYVLDYKVDTRQPRTGGTVLDP